MNSLSFTLAAPSSASAAGSTPANQPGSNQATDTDFKQLLDDSTSTARTDAGQNNGNPRPGPAKEDADTDSSSTTEQAGKTRTDPARHDDNDSNGDDDSDADATWPPPGLSMLAPTEPAPAPGAETQLAGNLLPAATPAPDAATATTDTAGNTPANASAPPGNLNGSSIVAASSADPEPAATTATASPTLAAAAIADKTDGDTGTDTGIASVQAFGQLLQSATATTTENRLPATPFSGELAKPVDVQAGDFDDAIGARVGWLADQKIGHAHIRVTPNDLGPVEVRLQLDGDRVHASFTSAHAEVRHALESSLPKLREMLGEQGLQLAHADVGQQHADPHRSSEDGSASGPFAGTDADDDSRVSDASSSALQHIRLRGLLDAYA